MFWLLLALREKCGRQNQGTAQQNSTKMHLYAESKEELRYLIRDLQDKVITFDEGEFDNDKGF